jgi:hypothetical protein
MRTAAAPREQIPASSLIDLPSAPGVRSRHSNKPRVRIRREGAARFFEEQGRQNNANYRKGSQ